MANILIHSCTRGAVELNIAVNQTKSDIRAIFIWFIIGKNQMKKQFEAFYGLRYHKSHWDNPWNDTELYWNLFMYSTWTIEFLLHHPWHVHFRSQCKSIEWNKNRCKFNNDDVFKLKRNCLTWMTGDNRIIKWKWFSLSLHCDAFCFVLFEQHWN